MSKKGFWNYNAVKRNDQLAGRIVRDLIAGEDLDLFLSDIGDEPMSKEKAFELGFDGGLPLVERKVGVRRMQPWRYGPISFMPIYKVEQPEPALPVDAIRPFDMGLGLHLAHWEEVQNDYWGRESGWDDDFEADLWPAPLPEESVEIAFQVTEARQWCNKEAQEYAMWDELERQREFDANPLFASF